MALQRLLQGPVCPGLPPKSVIVESRLPAAMPHTDMGLLSPWLRNIRDVYRLYQKGLDEIKDDGAKYPRLIELNVLEQCRNVIKTVIVQKSYHENRFPIVHGWAYDLKGGLLKDLNLVSKRLCKVSRRFMIGSEGLLARIALFDGV
jgi:hypothetical protein